MSRPILTTVSSRQETRAKSTQSRTMRNLSVSHCRLTVPSPGNPREYLHKLYIARS